MKMGFGIAGLFACLALSATAYGADATGTWKGAFDFQGSSMPLTFHLAVADGAVTGTVEGLPTNPAEIHDGKLTGDTITFWVNTDYQGQTYKIVYTGKLATAGDEIAFTFGTDDGSWSAQLTVARSADTAPAAALAPVDLNGTWKGSFDFNGASMPLTIHLTNAAGAVTGTVEGLPTTPAEIHDGKVDGDRVTFWLNTDYQGQTYKLVYTGKISAGQIVFTFGTDDGSWSTQLTATKNSGQ
ncbi:exported hypothetical protein [Candidatus Sulfotelmatomonas gaucii]|uniref:Lipoprotein n=1 Tax=Candidatus Sulfuritelmatomonas gaucii TaxID=2043161 RepID=A0A2N9LK25_9BACT|nr:exported hypothetical protein [Candidatus Sulfotelmatomonas gaucii]